MINAGLSDRLGAALSASQLAGRGVQFGKVSCSAERSVSDSQGKPIATLDPLQAALFDAISDRGIVDLNHDRS